MLYYQIFLGDEDHLGDMDFKVTGTADGITACQMDIKIKGLRFDIHDQALNQARKEDCTFLKTLRHYCYSNRRCKSTCS